MQGHLSIFIFCSLVFYGMCLFRTTPLAKFKSPDLKNPTRVIVNEDGTRFMMWNNMSSFQIWENTGKRRCASNVPYPIMKVIWPTNYDALMLLFPGKIVYRIQDNHCTQNRQYDLADEAHEMTFIWRDQLPILLVTILKEGYFFQYNLNPFSNIKSYTSYNYGTTDKAISAVYAPKANSIYTLQMKSTGNMLRLESFDTSVGISTQNVELPYMLSGMTIATNGKDAFCLATSLNGTQTNIIKFTSNLVVTTALQRQQLKFAVGIRQDNYMVLVKPISTEIELINTKDGQSKQKINYFQNSTFIQDCDYKATSMVLLDDQGYFVVAYYSPTPESDPVNPQRPKPFPIWEIIAIAVSGLILLTILLMFIFRKKLPDKLKRILPRWFTGVKKNQNSLLQSHEKNVDQDNIEEQQDIKQSFHSNYNAVQVDEDKGQVGQLDSDRGDGVSNYAQDDKRQSIVSDEIKIQPNLDDLPDEVKMARLAQMMMNQQNQHQNDEIPPYHQHQYEQQQQDQDGDNKNNEGIHQQKEDMDNWRLRRINPNFPQFFEVKGKRK